MSAQPMQGARFVLLPEERRHAIWRLSLGSAKRIAFVDDLSDTYSWACSESADLIAISQSKRIDVYSGLASEELSLLTRIDTTRIDPERQHCPVSVAMAGEVLYVSGYDFKARLYRLYTVEVRAPAQVTPFASKYSQGDVLWDPNPAPLALFGSTVMGERMFVAAGFLSCASGLVEMDVSLPGQPTELRVQGWSSIHRYEHVHSMAASATFVATASTGAHHTTNTGVKICNRATLKRHSMVGGASTDECGAYRLRGGSPYGHGFNHLDAFDEQLLVACMKMGVALVDTRPFLTTVADVDVEDESPAVEPPDVEWRNWYEDHPHVRWIRRDDAVATHAHFCGPNQCLVAWRMPDASSVVSLETLPRW